MNTRLRIASVLGLIWVVSLVFHTFDARAFFLPLFSIALVVGLDLLITYGRKRRLYLPASSIVTGFLIGLIFAPTEPLFVFVLASLLAVCSKQVVRVGEHRHVFNPAAFGIITTSFLTGAPVSWWAVSFSPWMALIPLGASYTLWQLKRLFLPITFLMAYWTLVSLGEGQVFVSLLFDGTLMLFAFIMLPEPITSPAAGKWKYAFGPIVAVIAIILPELMRGIYSSNILLGKVGVLPDVFLPALLLGNLLGFLAKRYLR